MRTLLIAILFCATTALAADPPPPRRGMNERRCRWINLELEMLLKDQKSVCPRACKGVDREISGCATAGDTWRSLCYVEGKEACGSEPPVCVTWPTPPKNC